MRYLAILNRDGGTLRTTDLEDLCARAVDIFTRHGHQFECRIVSGGEVAEALAAAAEVPGIDVILAGGGDGTISTAAAVAFRKKIPLAVLPAGTMNLFARALRLPLDLDGALQALAGGQISAIDIATANGRPFVHQFGVGLHARLVRTRDAMTYRSRWGKILASVRAFISTISRPPNFAIEIRMPDGGKRRRASGIAVCNNRIEGGHLPYAERLDGGVLGIYIAAPMSPWSLVRLAIDVLRGRWRDSPEVWELELPEIHLRFPKLRRSNTAVIDGELIKLERDVVLKLHPLALQVITPMPVQD